MSTEYNYDDQGQFFPFFFVTVAGLVTLPVTYSLLKPSKGQLLCRCVHAHKHSPPFVTRP
jgi:preprotein translocase subunit Sec63